ncbi:glycoside hydrolase superfamily [Gaertneriomyces semiglobifer]|nr:glycoside hydrolase superfamily [Gaertneriomyces semiglobifer]
MGYRQRRLFCGLLFWLKVTFAIALSFAGLAFLGLRVYTENKDALKNDLPLHSPIRINPEDPACVHNAATGLGRLEPENGIYIGYSLDWSQVTPEKVNNRLKRKMAVPTAFLKLDPTTTPPYNKDMLQWHAEETARAGGILQVTLEPVINDLTTIPQAMLEDFALQCQDINSKMGVPIIIRYGHEMNGDWTAYGLKPTTFTAGFQTLSTIIHTYTNMTAMLWSPNVGIAYPWGVNPVGPMPAQWPLPGSPDFIALDTNGDGAITFMDDPYLPFYPGDEYVDWVGLSLYYYPDTIQPSVVAPSIPPPDFFASYLTGEGERAAMPAGGAANVDLAARNFYGRFAIERNKPLAISESGAPWMVGSAESELQVKQAWWTQTLSPETIARFPKLKLMVNFEERKDENGALKDWALTTNDAVLTPYLNYLDTADKGHMIWADGLKFACGGQVQATPR